MADAAFGSIRHGVWQKLRSPIPCESNRSISVEIQNAQLKLANFTVQVQFHGLEDWRPPEIIEAEMKKLREVNLRRQTRA
jgi:hypothetical protein